MRDKLDEQIATEFKKLGIDLSDEDLQVVRARYEADLTMRRIFEPMPHNWETAFAVGDKIELNRPFFGIPVGVVGVIKEIETAYNADGSSKEEWELSADFFKGRPYLVEFDCTHIPLDEQEKAAIKRLFEQCSIQEEIPNTRGRVQTNIAPHDIRKVLT